MTFYNTVHFTPQCCVFKNIDNTANEYHNLIKEMLMDDKKEDIPFVLDTGQTTEEGMELIVSRTYHSIVFFESKLEGWVWICKQVNRENHENVKNGIYYEIMTDPIYGDNHVIKVMGSNWFVRIPWDEWFDNICGGVYMNLHTVSKPLIIRTIEYLNSNDNKADIRYKPIQFIYNDKVL